MLRKFSFIFIFILIMVIISLAYVKVQNFLKECAKFNLCYPDSSFSCLKYITYRSPKEMCVSEWLRNVDKFILNNPRYKNVAASVLISSLDKVDNIQTCDGVLALRNELIEILAKTDDPSAINPLINEVVHPKDEIFSSGAFGCKARKAASFEAAMMALIKLGKNLDEIPVDLEKVFSNKPQFAVGLITEILTSEQRLRFDAWKNLKIHDERIVNLLISVIKSCESDDCIFYIVPFLTRANKNQELALMLQDILKNKSKKLSWSTKYVLEMSLKSLKENSIFCISRNLDNLFLLEHGILPHDLTITDYRQIDLIKEVERKKIKKMIEENTDYSKCFRIGVMGNGALHYYSPS